MSKNRLRIFFFSWKLQMRIFQLLTRFTCIKFSFFLEGIFLSPIVLIVYNKNGPIRMQYLSVCQEGSDGSQSLL